MTTITKVESNNAIGRNFIVTIVESVRSILRLLLRCPNQPTRLVETLPLLLQKMCVANLIRSANFQVRVNETSVLRRHSNTPEPPEFFKPFG